MMGEATRQNSRSSRTPSEAADPDAIVDGLVEAWVRGLEREERPGARRQEPPPFERAQPRQVEPSSGLGGEATIVAVPGGDGQRSLFSVVTVRSRAVHVGTVSVRGPEAPSRQEYLGLGLNEAETDALIFVGHWFGAAFDAVNARSRADQALNLGWWQLTGPALVSCLACWKRRDAAGFGRRMAAQGIDISEPPDPTLPPELLVRVASRDPTHGLDAARTIAGSPQLVAVLAQAGRDRKGQLAQIEAVVECSLRPAMATPVPGTSPHRMLGQQLRSAKQIAVALHADLVFGIKGPARVAAAIAGASQGEMDEMDAKLASYADQLARAGHSRACDEVRRILTSPELHRP